MEMLLYNWVLLVEVISINYDCNVLGVYDLTSCDVILHPGPNDTVHFPSIASFYRTYDTLLIICPNYLKSVEISNQLSDNTIVERSIHKIIQEEEK